jgi:hypothetical protein
MGNEFKMDVAPADRGIIPRVMDDVGLLTSSYGTALTFVAFAETRLCACRFSKLLETRQRTRKSS